MRCINCQNLSLEIICTDCKNSLLKESISKRFIDNLEVISLFAYSEIEPLIVSKYETFGYRVYKYFAKRHLREFLKIFVREFKREIYIIGVDEKINRAGYSHTALLSHYSKSANVTPLHTSLIAKSGVSYAKRSKSFRLNNPRDFVYRGLRGVDAVLIDDVITTGTTIKEAKNILESCGVNLLFAITLADAQR